MVFTCQYCSTIAPWQTIGGTNIIHFRGGLVGYRHFVETNLFSLSDIEPTFLGFAAHILTMPIPFPYK